MQKASEAGGLAPDSVVNEMVKERLAQADARDGFILDGYPRTVSQAQALAAYQAIDLVLDIQLPKHVLLQKLLGRRVCGVCGRNYNVASIKEGDMDMPPLMPKPSDCDTCKGQPKLETRKDDTEAVIATRLDVYERDTAPVLDFYRKAGKIETFQVKLGMGDLPRLRTVLGIPADH